MVQSMPSPLARSVPGAAYTSLRIRAGGGGNSLPGTRAFNAPSQVRALSESTFVPPL